ncbi:MAG: CPBP family intramembrane metalloprotease [Anaerolineales bacterium]|jgi:membrane protease YdiL (CAAX protease family)|nr:CPBP family intramembrane metalloprotease [Anaerolineales bacterium]
MMPTTKLTLDNNEENTQTWSFLDLIIILLGIGIIFAIFFFILRWFSNLAYVNIDVVSEPTTAQSLGLAAVEAIALLAGVYYFGLRRLHYRWKDIGFNKIESKWLVATILISIIVIPLSGLITILVMLALGLPLENPQLEFLIPDDFSWMSGVGIFILGGIIVPIAEEVFFRGVLYKWLRERWGVFIGISVSSFIFGLVHIDIAIAATAFMLGIILALVYEYSNSLWTAILIHIINNGIKIILLYLLFVLGIQM